MLIVCPACASEYHIDAAHLGAQGRTVRCASCRATWFADGATEAEEPALEPALTIPAESGRKEARVPEPRAPKPRRRPRLPALLSALLSALLARLRPRPAPALAVTALVLVAGAVAGRATVVRALPETARLYDRVGLPVNLHGLTFHALRSETLRTPSGTTLVVEGEVLGAARSAVPVPPIGITLRGADGQALYAWTIDPPRQTMSEGEAAPFRARLASPPPEAREVLVRFAPDGAKAAAAASKDRS